jgi:hypothetical protein
LQQRGGLVGALARKTVPLLAFFSHAGPKSLNIETWFTEHGYPHEHWDFSSLT